MKDKKHAIHPKGPIEYFSWGKFIVCGKEHAKSDVGKTGAGKDIRLIGEDVTPWRERKGHLLTPAMITGIYDQGVEALIIGNGVNGDLQCPEEVRRVIKERGIAELFIERTPAACSKYNQLFAEGRRVALLAHGTC